MRQQNPFVIEGYRGPDYFCDRESETALLKRHLTNGCNVALIAPRRLGKSGLIYHLFHQEEIQNDYYPIYIDIYETKNLSEFVYVLGKGILSVLRTKGRKAWEYFLTILQSLRSTITFDIQGNPEWNVGIGDIKYPDVTLDELFDYLEKADKPCLVAIDEFQTIANYPEKTVEASLRKRIQQCQNARFIYAGSKRHMMAQIFSSSARPFYNSSAIMGLEPIDRKVYWEFANRHLASNGKSIDEKAFQYLYDTYEGITWYMQYTLNMLYTSLSDSPKLSLADVQAVEAEILSQQRFSYQALLYQMTAKQKQVLTAIAQEQKAASVLSQTFLQKYQIGASTVQGAIKVLLAADFITNDQGVYEVCDKFFERYLRASTR